MKQFITIVFLIGCYVSNSLSAETKPDCAAKLDIVFIMDTSGSIGVLNFKIMIDFAKNLSTKFDVGEDQVRIGSETFGSSASINFHLNAHHDLPSLNTAFDNILYTGGGTNTAQALMFAYTYMFIESNGDRPEVPNIAIVITDGQSNRPADTIVEAQNLRDHGVQVFAIGIGYGINENELNAIATDPDSDHVFTVGDFNELAQITAALGNKACTVPLLLYGDDAGDTEYTGIDDDCAGPIAFPQPVPIFDRTYTTIYPCANGLASLEQPYTTSYPSKGVDIAAIYDLFMPLHADIDFRNHSALYYNHYDRTSTDSAHKQNFATVEQYIRQMYVIAFKPDYMVVSTWHEAPRYGGKSPKANATFQMALFTDWTKTYVIYIYGEDRMRWDPDVGSPNTLIGYQVNQAVRNDTHILSFTTASYQMDKHAETNGVRGIISHKLADDNGLGNSPLTHCLQWYEAFKDTDVIPNPELLQCPCTLQLLEQENHFYEDTSTSVGKNTRCFVTWYNRRTRPHAMKCCYNKDGDWIRRFKGPGGFLYYHPYVYPHLYSKFDATPRTDCCDSVGNSCKTKYRELRPVGQCFTQTPSNFAGLFGDPHILTLDGKGYTFNGLGEYILMQVDTADTPDVEFELQGRTGRAVTLAGNTTDATVFVAFAAKDHTGATLHVEMDAAKTGLVLFGNGIEHTVAFNDASMPFNYTGVDALDSLVLFSSNGTLNVIFSEPDISLSIRLDVGMLDISVRVNKSLSGQTKGLLGNCDGDPDNDYRFRNGTTLGFNSTEKQLYPLGQSWMISPDESLFRYFNGLGASNHSDPDFVPRFLEDEGKEVVDNATQFCGERNLACIYDLVLTNIPAVAIITNSTDSDSQYMVAVSNNNIPIVNSSDQIRATVGDVVTTLVQVYDEDPVTFHLTGTATFGNVTDNSATFTWVADSSSQLPFSLTVVDSLGMSSAELQLDVVLCDGCSGNGQCDFTTVVSGDDTEDTTPITASCDCHSLHGIPLWTGVSCEDDFDGCASSPCAIGQTCTDLNAADHQQQKRSHQCGPCPDGYGNDGSKCSDIDECAAGVHDCEQLCINTEPGYDCTCGQGYRLQPGSPKQCEDVNECTEALHDCDHKCTNTPGTYNCSCFAGYKLDSNTTCIRDTTVDECALVGIDCNATAGCTNETGTPSCFCTNGYELTSDGFGCTNIDECELNFCPQLCNDTDGSFECSCYAGYELKDDSVNCQECDAAYWGVNCENLCVCGRGTASCDRVRGCVCKSGYTDISCNEDIDECAAIPGPCSGPRQLCNNTIGSYFCTCEEGYQMTSDGQCEDIDECSSPGLNDCQQQCSNTPGSFVCSCMTGYVVNDTDPTQCTDLDECEAGISTCEHICQNVPGKYNCECYFGYELNADRITCAQVEDVCAKYGGVNCSHICVVDHSSISCGCPLGYELDSDNQTCTDVDECASSILNRCSQKDLCTNIDGGYLCDCPAGKELQNDNRTCQVCDGYHYGDNCAMPCGCGVGNDHCDPVVGCTCRAGWVGQKCDTDVDECAEGPNNCTGKNMRCVNLPGSHSCQCKDGYQEEASGDCEDINECESPLLHTCTHICINTNGSFYCECQPGYLLHTNGQCNDIDECAGSPDCQQTCSNTPGSYRCSCDSGYIQDTANTKQCLDIDECTAGIHSCADTHTCANTDGAYLCLCDPGFTGPHCDTDIDECTEGIHSCADTGTCVNVNGSYTCDCNPGYTGQYCESNNCEHAPCRHDCTVTSDGYECSCRRGYTQHHRHHHLCIAIQIGVSLRIYGTFTADLEDPTNPRFQQLATDVCNQMDKAMHNSILTKRYIGCDVTDFRKGSIIVHTTISLDSSTTTSEDGEDVLIYPEHVTDAIDDNRQPNDTILILDIGSANVEQGFDECDAQEDNCEHTCVDLDIGFACSCRDGYSSRSHPNQHQCTKSMREAVVISVSVVCGVVLLAVVVVIAIYCFRRQSHRMRRYAFGPGDGHVIDRSSFMAGSSKTEHGDLPPRPYTTSSELGCTNHSYGRFNET